MTYTLELSVAATHPLQYTLACLLMGNVINGPYFVINGPFIGRHFVVHLCWIRLREDGFTSEMVLYERKDRISKFVRRLEIRCMRRSGS